MAEAITVSYVEHEDDWSVTVSGLGEERTEHAPGIIAARDAADQIIDSIKPAEEESAVVHLLNGSALDFTTAYMTARLDRTENVDQEIPEQPTTREPQESDRETATEGAGEEAESATAS